MNETIEELLKIIFWDDEDPDNLHAHVSKDYLIELLGKSYLAGAAAKEAEVREMIQEYLKEIDGASQLNDEEKGLVMWGIENIEIRLSALNKS